MSPTDPLHVRVALVGAGFSGIAAAVALKRDGVEDFVILERAAAAVGATRTTRHGLHSE